MPVSIIDVLEVIDVDHRNGKGARVSTRLLEACHELLIERPAVSQVRQRIGSRELLEAAIACDQRLLQLDDASTGADTREQLLQLKWLRDVVVSSATEASELSLLARIAGQDEDEAMRILIAHFIAQLDSVSVRQAPVKKEKVPISSL